MTAKDDSALLAASTRFRESLGQVPSGFENTPFKPDRLHLRGRVLELDERRASTGATLGWFESALTLLVQAVLSSDLDALDAIRVTATNIRRDLIVENDATTGTEVHGAARLLAEAARVGADRIKGRSQVRRGTHAADMCEYLIEHPGASGRDLAEALGVDASQISRVARDLQALGLILRERAGKAVAWHLTPSGADLLRSWSKPSSPSELDEHVLVALAERDKNTGQVGLRSGHDVAMGPNLAGPDAVVNESRQLETSKHRYLAHQKAFERRGAASMITGDDDVLDPVG